MSKYFIQEHLFIYNIEKNHFRNFPYIFFEFFPDVGYGGIL